MILCFTKVTRISCVKCMIQHELQHCRKGKGKKGWNSALKFIFNRREWASRKMISLLERVGWGLLVEVCQDVIINEGT